MPANIDTDPHILTEAEIKELRTDRRYSIGLALGSLAAFSAFGGVTWAAVTGRIGGEGYVSLAGMAAFGKASASTIGQAIELTQKIKSAEAAQKSEK